MVQGDLRYFDPGGQVPVRVVADASGNVPERGDPVELAGEDGGQTEVRAASSEAVGALEKEPQEYDPDENYAADEVVGSGTILVDGPVDWYDEAAIASDPSVGDEVVLGPNGVFEAGQVANEGTETQSGDGTATTFQIPHGLTASPAVRNVWAESADAAGAFYVSDVTGNHIEVTYDTAPADGNDNLTWGFEAKKSALTTPYGVVFATGTRVSAMTAEKVAVLRYK